MVLAGLCIAYNESGKLEMGAHVSFLFAGIFPDHGQPHLIRADSLRKMNQFRAERESLVHALMISPEVACNPSSPCSFHG